MVCRSVLLVAVLAAAVGYYSYVPVPDGFAKPIGVGLICSAIEFAMLLFEAAEMCNLSTSASLMRMLCHWSAITLYEDQSIQVEDVMFDGVKVRLYKPLTIDHKVAGMVYFHGGGWTFGNPSFTDPLTRRIATSLNMVVASVDYRLSPEHTFPTPVDDCELATLYFMKHAATLGVDASRICLAGDSAGGNLAAAISLKLRDAHPDVPRVKLQVLLYPMLQAIDFRLPSIQTNRRAPLLGRRRLATYWLNYALGDAAYVDVLLANRHTSRDVQRVMSESHVDWSRLPERFRSSIAADVHPADGNATLWQRIAPVFLDPYFAPLMARDLRDLPPAYIHTAEADVLRDEAWMYAGRLTEAGVNVTHVHKHVDFHDMITLPHLIREADVYLQELLLFLADNL